MYGTTVDWLVLPFDSTIAAIISYYDILIIQSNQMDMIVCPLKYC